MSEEKFAWSRPEVRPNQDLQRLVLLRLPEIQRPTAHALLRKVESYERCPNAKSIYHIHHSLRPEGSFIRVTQQQKQAIELFSYCLW